MVFPLLGWGLCIALDIFITKRRIAAYGPGVEINLLVRRYPILGIVSPSLIWLSLMIALRIPAIAWWMFGFRAQLSLWQLKSLLEEK